MQSLNLVICLKSGRNALLADFKFGSLILSSLHGYIGGP